ncbi:asparagine synthase (glutamine-hydrolyzing) [Silicimonas algicola]|uniref:asparagine synthase (glutamine-hydrolyzing) n=1 Tax=Silicimonas algicola TaxID=1826607 RepID=A0A316FZJ3_9RHOB|nr:asparagine synthase (glutamine-hydrolyzing) [Silicimonas algicola]AZQ66759.1 asparagine synthase (glutamine-hydrolyzing) [Silicimonas algicola]PWK53126.1 asparagine synthase (glutamine-hydrolysing) [Silicimonas algicola]
MCGINGIFAYHYAANPVDRAELICTRDYMAARGPDATGVWLAEDGRIGFGHRRLAIIDLTEGGAQPMANADGSLVVTFNGEIYNYREIRLGLESKGHVFRSNSDTEVLLHLYAAKGEAMVHDLRGMFAFAIWDARRGMTFMARDPYGIKPLYYADDGWTLRFASSVKALISGGKVSTDPEPAGWAGFYLFGSVPEPFTTYQEVRALPAGSTLRVDAQGPRVPQPYFSVAAIYAQQNGEWAGSASGRDAQEQARTALLDSVRAHLVADVPVGAFLSAGIDSGALVGLMRDAGQTDITTVTLAFDEFEGRHDDEAPLAAEVARYYGTHHHRRLVTEREFHQDLPGILDAMDQPSIDGLNTWFVSKAASELGLKVAISGLGGDELFGGYPSFRDIPRWHRLLAVPSRLPFLGDIARLALTAGRPLWPGLNPKTAGLLKYGGTYAGGYMLRRGLFMPWELDTVMDPPMAREGLQRLKPLAYIREALDPMPESSFARVAALEASLYMRNQLLRDTDWASMAHSLEVRVPLVDSYLLAALNPALHTTGGLDTKFMLAMSPAKPLPDKVIHRPKTGFTTPIASWLQRGRRFQKWKKKSVLTDAHCPWARRWAYSVAVA